MKRFSSKVLSWGLAVIMVVALLPIASAPVFAATGNHLALGPCTAMDSNSITLGTKTFMFEPGFTFSSEFIGDFVVLTLRNDRVVHIKRMDVITGTLDDLTGSSTGLIISGNQYTLAPGADLSFLGMGERMFRQEVRCYAYEGQIYFVRFISVVDDVRLSASLSVRGSDPNYELILRVFYDVDRNHIALAGRRIEEILYEFTITAPQGFTFNIGNRNSNTQTWRASDLGVHGVPITLGGNEFRVTIPMVRTGSLPTGPVTVRCRVKTNLGELPEISRQIIFDHQSVTPHPTTDTGTSRKTIRDAQTALSRAQNNTTVVNMWTLNDLFNQSNNRPSKEVDALKRILLTWMSAVSASYDHKDAEDIIKSLCSDWDTHSVFQLPQILGGFRGRFEAFYLDVDVITKFDPQKPERIRFKLNFESYFGPDSGESAKWGAVSWKIITRNSKVPAHYSENYRLLGGFVSASADDFRRIFSELANNAIEDVQQSVATGLLEDIISGVITSRYGKFEKKIFDMTNMARNHSRFRINSPVDIYVYGNDGTLHGSIINNKVSVDAIILMEVNGSEKIFYLVGDERCRIELIGNGAGTMNYTIEEYANGFDVSRKAEFLNVPLTAGKKYTMNISGSQSNTTPFTLQADDGITIRPNNDTNNASSNAPSAWAKDAVDRAIRLGIIPSSLQSAYTRNITRAEFCAIAVSMYEYLSGTEIKERKTFDDTNDINVQKLAGLGIVQGDGMGGFDPNGIFTREMAITLMYNMMLQRGNKFEVSAPNFADANNIASWATSAIGALQKAGIVQGDGTNFSPKQNFTREMSIVTVMNFLDMLE